MSSYAANIARWNAIPMDRETSKSSPGTKRSRSRSASPVLKLQGEYDSSDEDNVSLVSRSPSPSMVDVTTYDQGHTAPEEVITVETKIKSTNKGYSILAKLGWIAGQPLGLSGEGRVDPIPFSIKNDVTGLGKRAQDERMIETTVSQRRGLDSERQIKETTEQRQFREQKVAEQEALKNQIASTLKSFYCALCDKQYQTVAQYDEHTNSYAHHHKQRFKDMQTNAKGIGGGRQDKEARLAKEKKREEKELKRMAKAQGVKVGALGGVVASNASKSVAQPAEEPKGFKKSGWAAVSTPIAPTQAEMRASGSLKGPGWATVSGSASLGTSPPEPVSRSASTTSTPGFRTAGFETLNTTAVTQAATFTTPGGSNADVNEPSSQSRFWGSSTSIVAPLVGPSPAAAPPPPLCAAPPPPPSGAPPPPPPPPLCTAPPPPSWPPSPNYRSTRSPSPCGLPFSPHAAKSSLSHSSCEPSLPDPYPRGVRPPSPRTAIPRRSHSPPPPHRDRYDVRGRWDRSTYQGYPGGSR